MSNNFDDSNFQCPFYLHQSETRIFCEGYIEGTHMITAFPNQAQKKDHEKAYCYLMDGGKCPFAKMLFRKYDEDDIK